MFFKLFTDCHEHHAGTKLRNAKVRGVKQSPVRRVAKLGELIIDVSPEVIEDVIKQTANVLKHHSSGTNFIYKINSFWKQITFIFRTQLLSSLREWRAWDPTSQEVCAGKL